jgi:hypothetical protein
VKVPELKGVALSPTVVMVMIVLSLLPILIRFGIYFNLSNLFLEDVYDTRNMFNEQTTTFINYLYPWLVKAAVPLLLVFFLIQRKYFYAMLCLIILIYLYLLSGNKLVYITSFVVLFFFFIGNDYFEKIKYFMMVLILGLLLMPLVDNVLNSHILKGTFVMRMFFFPAHINYYYFDFFKGDPLYFAESNLMRFFLTYPYDRAIGFVISETYFNVADMNLNNGIISDGYMNLGYYGIALNIVIVAVIFIFFNSIALDSRYLGVFFVMVFLFLSAPMLSMFITSGLWIIFLMAMTIMKKESDGQPG